MASTAAVAQSYNDTNVLGEVLEIGATRNTGQFFNIIAQNGVKRVSSQQFAMSATFALDAAAQGAISETTSLTAGTPEFYAKTQEWNVTQISKEEVQVSSLRGAAVQQLDTTNISAGGLAPTESEFERNAAAKFKQIQANWEFGVLQGTYVNRAAVGTTVAMGGLTDATIGISTSTEAAGGAALDKAIIDALLVKMADNGAPFSRPVIVATATYIKDISEIYGFQPQSWDVGGVAVKTIMSDFGEIGVVWTNAAPANTVIVADVAYIQPVVLPHETGQDILFKEFEDGGSARRGYIEGFLGVDFDTESYHGSITGIA